MLSFQVVSFGLVATVVMATTPYNRIPHWKDQESGASSKEKMSIYIPPAESRNQDRCELYENEDWGSAGCRTRCAVSGYFGSVRIEDAEPRKVDQCKTLATYCIIPVFTSEQLNVTYNQGQCDENCHCVPVTTQNAERMRAKALIGTLIGTHHHHKKHHHALKEGKTNEVNSIKVRIPAPESRNSSQCENYEQSWYPGSSQSGDDMCKDVCTVIGNIGGLTFQGAPRYLDSVKPDGYYCMRKTSGDATMSALSQGKCVQGMCKPLDFEEPSTPASPPMPPMAPRYTPLNQKKVATHKRPNELDSSASSSSESSEEN